MKKALTIGCLIISATFCTGQIKYPISRKVNTTTNYHDTLVADPYRWLENDNSEETKTWVTQQNILTFGYLNNIPFKAAWLNRMEEIINFPRYGSPFRKSEYFYFYLNSGLQNQSVLYRQKGLTGTPTAIIDPNKFSVDGTTRLTSFQLSKNGQYAVIGKSQGGSDWESYFVMNIKTLQYLPDSITWIKASSIAWQGNGFYYSRYPTPDKGKELSTKNENHQVYFHKVGTPQKEDELIYEDKSNVQRFHTVFTSEDERYVFMSISDRGKAKDGDALWYFDNKSDNKNFKPLTKDPGDFTYTFIDEINGNFLLQTNDEAKNGKVILMNPNQPESSNWKTIIPEKEEVISSCHSAGKKLFVTYLKDVSNRVSVYSLNGKLEREVKLPALGSASGFWGEKDDKFVFYTFTSFSFPPTIYKYDIATGTSTIFRKPNIKFNTENFVTEQVFYPSKDGTKIPLFIVYKKGMKLTGKNPVILYGYGGFNVELTPGFSAARITWLEQGGIWAQANLRGGSEYGEKWHEAGMRLKKQNVFDDFIAAGEFLITKKYTSNNYLAIQGGSNGGLLVGAVMNQRPDLFKVAIPQVGVMDMLRFQKFTVGWNWVAEYGSSDTPEEFKNLVSYSPIHNIKENLNYPATLITTADHDDRVVPAHSFKYAATLQEKYKGGNPVLIRIDVNSGHGASNLKKNLETTSDIYSFIFYNMGISPKFNTTTSKKQQ